MANKPTYKELFRRVQELEKQAFTYAEAKETLRKSIRQSGLNATVPVEPNVAVEVLDEGLNGTQPLKQAFIAEHLFRKAIEGAVPCGLVGIDDTGLQVYANRSFSKMVGWPEKEISGTKFPTPFIPREKVSLFEKEIQALVSGMVPEGGIELPLQRRDGTVFWGLVFGAPMMDSKGRTVGQLFAIVDITGRKTAENARRKLSSRLIGAQERERRLISQDLHDSIGGKLTGIKYGLESVIAKLGVPAPEWLPTMKELVAAVRTTLEETQRITKNLHPSILDDLGLMAAIRGQCQEFQKFFPEIHIHLEAEAEDGDIPGAKKVLIFRVLQEALNNVAKHSGAENVRISLRTLADRVELRIEDNGMGFDPASIKGSPKRDRGLGIESMRERTDLFGGSLKIHSAPQGGTRIEAIWPLSSSGGPDH